MQSTVWKIFSIGSMLAAGIGCADDQATQTPDPIGAVGFELTLPGGIVIEQVEYAVTNTTPGSLFQPISGTIRLTEPGATASVFIQGIPLATGYLADLSARSLDDRTLCGGQMAFDEMNAGTHRLNMILHCFTYDIGSILVKGSFQPCPRVTSMLVQPLAVTTGGVIDVSATAVAGSSDFPNLTYEWRSTNGSSTNGTFADPSALSTTYTCPPFPGDQRISFSVFDGVCEASQGFPVGCLAP